MLSEEDKKVVEETKEFVKKMFQENPHYSFNDWTVMYDHCCTVGLLASTLAQSVECDELLAYVGALLHDIGKTHKADQQTLHREHDSFNLLMSEAFLNTLTISESRLEKLKRIVAYEDESVEMNVIKDADALALPSDKRLYMLFIEWAHKEGLESSIQRKLDKFSKLRFEVSKEIGEPLFRVMKQDWEEYRKLHS